jgi:prophage regulatory protein
MKIIKLTDVMRMTGLSRSSIYAFIAQKKFPSAINLGERAVGWQESEVQEWLKGRVAIRKGK